MKLLRILLLLTFILHLTGTVSAEINRNVESTGETKIISEVANIKIIKPANKIYFAKLVKNGQDLSKYGIQFVTDIKTAEQFLIQQRGYRIGYAEREGYLKIDNNNDVINMEVINTWTSNTDYGVLYNIPNNDAIRNRILEAKTITIITWGLSGRALTYNIHPDVLSEWKQVINTFN